MFVCSFTFLAVMAHTASDMFEGEMTYSGKARGINGFLFFILILLMGLGLGILFALIPPVTGVATVWFGFAMVLKFLVVFLSVYAAARWASAGWARSSTTPSRTRQRPRTEVGKRELRPRQRLARQTEAVSQLPE